MLFSSRNTNPDEFSSYVEQMIAHQPRLRAFIHSLAPQSRHVSDVLQNTNAVLWQKRERFTPGTNFTAWAFKIARYQVKHQLYRDGRDGRLVFSDDLIEKISAETPQDDSQDHVLKALEGCLAKLTEHQRSLIHARYCSGQSIEQYAASVGRSAGSLRIALHRVRDLIKDCVETTLASESA